MRRKEMLQDVDVATWPVVAYTAFGEIQQRAFLKRRDAVERYVRGELVRAIEPAPASIAANSIACLSGAWPCMMTAGSMAFAR